jgi:ATP-dependent protease Clp ATPase subunit
MLVNEILYMMSNVEETVLHCKFCHKTQDEVAVLLAFSKDFSVCDECVWLMVEIIATDRPDWRDRTIEKLKNVGPKTAQK